MDNIGYMSFNFEDASKDASFLSRFQIDIWGESYNGIGEKELKKTLFSLSKKAGTEKVYVYVYNLSILYCFCSHFAKNAFVTRGDCLKFEYLCFQFRSVLPITNMREEDFVRSNGGRSVIDCLKEMLSKYGEVEHYPLTSASMSRKEIEKQRECKYPTIRTWEEYKDFCDALNGGMVICKETTEPVKNVRRIDIKSSYPYIMYTMGFPVSMKEIPVENVSRLIEMGKSVIALCVIKNVRRKSPLSVPYLGIENGDERVERWLTEIDIDILRGEYDFDLELVRAYSGTKQLLPDNIRNAVKVLYKEKNKTPKGTPQYYSVKIALNSMAGAMQMIAKGEDGKPDEEEYKKRRFQKNTFPIYWGVYVTAYGRKAMYNAIVSIRKQGGRIYYGDTDSVFFAGEKVSISTINSEHIDTMGGAGRFEEDEKAKRIMIIAPKTYAYENEKGECIIKVAGGSGTLKRFSDFKNGKSYEVEICKQILLDEEREVNGHIIPKCCVVHATEKRILGGKHYGNC